MGYWVPLLFNTLLISGWVRSMARSLGKTAVESWHESLTHCLRAARPFIAALNLHLCKMHWCMTWVVIMVASEAALEHKLLECCYLARIFS